MPVPVIILLGLVGSAVAIAILVALIGPVFRGIGWLIRGLFAVIAHIARFIFATIADTLRIIGAVIAAVVFVPFVLLNVVIARWSAAAHFGRSLQRELGAMGAATYRLVIGNPARLLLLSAVTEGIEQRLPEAIAQAPGSDKPSKATGTFPGYKVVGSLRAGGSGGRLFVAEPLPEKRAALARAGVPVADQVVIKAFSVKDGATLDQIVRESRALEAARRLHLILDHELSSERFYYVTTYVPGENLSIVTQQLHARAGDAGLRGDTLRETLGYARDLLSTLDRYHGAGLWHKDIKPDNIIVHAGRAHLVDLGLVTPLASAMTLTTHGTEYFRDPEMVRMALRGVKVHEVDGVKFDIYGVGAVLYSVVENSFPAHGGLSQISKGCPEALRWIIRRSMTDLAHRYPTAREMLADIDCLARASDPFAIKPAELPSMREGDVEIPEPVREPEFAAVRAAYAASPMPPTPGASPTPTPTPVGATPADAFRAQPAQAGASSGKPRLRVLDWWTGKYAVDSSEDIPVARAGGARPRDPFGVREMRDAVQAAAWKTPNPANRARSMRSAREQLASAHARVQRRQRAAMARMVSRHARFNAGPNPGVGLAVVALVGFVGYLVVHSSRSHAVDATVREPAAPNMELTMRVIAPGQTLNVDMTGNEEMLLVNEDKAQMEVAITEGDGDERDFEAAPAAFLPRLLAGPMGTGKVGVLWDRASLDQDSIATLHQVADLLQDGGAVLVGYDDEKEDIDAAARMRSIIGVASLEQDGVRMAMTQWLISQNIRSLMIVEHDGPWVVLDLDGSGVKDAVEHATQAPAPPPPMRPIVPESQPAGI